MSSNEVIVKMHSMNTIDDDKLLFGVVMARYNDKWVIVRHKNRTTWEIPGGHRESGEIISDAAARELFEETGAKKFDLYPIGIYSYQFNNIINYGLLFYGDIHLIGELPPLEISENKLVDEIPNNLTHPEAHSTFFKAAFDYFKNSKWKEYEPLSYNFNIV